MQPELNLVMPTALAFGAFLALAFALAAYNHEPNSGLLVLPDRPMFGSAIS